MQYARWAGLSITRIMTAVCRQAGEYHTHPAREIYWYGNMQYASTHSVWYMIHNAIAVARRTQNYNIWTSANSSRLYTNGNTNVYRQAGKYHLNPAIYKWQMSYVSKHSVSYGIAQDHCLHFATTVPLYHCRISALVALMLKRGCRGQISTVPLSGQWHCTIAAFVQPFTTLASIGQHWLVLDINKVLTNRHRKCLPLTGPC